MLKPLPYRALAAFAVILACAACASAGGTSSSQRSSRGDVEEPAPPADGYGAESSDAAIRRFLDAADAENYAGMWAVFGTEEGAAIDRFGVAETEARMIVLSRLLKHDDYELRQANFAGLGSRRSRYEVTMRGTRKGTVVVPFVTVPDGRGRWYVEQLEADRLSSSAGP